LKSKEKPVSAESSVAQVGTSAALPDLPVATQEAGAGVVSEADAPIASKPTIVKKRKKSASTQVLGPRTNLRDTPAQQA
jgi:hypothetical protein